MKISNDSFEKYGTSGRVTCPKCGKEASLQLMRANNGLGMMGISIANYNHNYFALCENCGALYSLDEDSIKKSQKRVGMYKVREIDPEGFTYLQTLPLK